MLIHEHIRITATWFGSWAQSKARYEAECTMTGTANHIARDQADNFAQLRRLAHHRYQLWKKQQQQRAQGSKIFSKVTVHESVESPETSGPEGVGDGDVTRGRLDTVGFETSHESERQKVSPAPGAEVRPLQDTAERQYESPQVPDTTSDRVQLQVDEHRSDPPRTLDAAPEKVQIESLEELQCCGQPQSQVDEPRVTEESPSIVVPACNAHEKDREPRVESVLSVTFTNSPSFSAWKPCGKADEHRTKLCNVTFRGCDQSGLQLKSSCEMVDVAFIGCKFKRMAFMDVKLSNVTFRHVDFTDSAFYNLVLRNVTVAKPRFRKVLWRATHVENALIGSRSFLPLLGTKGIYGLQAPAVSSKTIQYTI